MFSGFMSTEELAPSISYVLDFVHTEKLERELYSKFHWGKSFIKPASTV